MSRHFDEAQVLGRAPWLLGDVDRDKTRHPQVVPTTGLIQRANEWWLFAVAVDVDDRVTVWGYASLSPGERQRARSPDADLEDLAQTAFVDREIALAGAEDLVITRWRTSAGSSGLLSAATDFLETWSRELDEQVPAVERFRTRLRTVATYRDVRRRRLKF